MSEISKLYRHFLQSSGVSTDSRHIKKGSIFFALKGENFDGNKYAAEALHKGASLAVIDERDYLKGEAYLLVDDTLKTLQALAVYHRGMLDIPIIGLTGTNGKTTTKELIREVLSRKYKTHATGGNLNNHIGVPLSVLGIEKDTEIAVIEMGANHRGEIAALCSIAQPTHGLITNIGKAHLEGFGSYEGVIRAKTELYTFLHRSAGMAFVHHDDPLLTELSSQLSRMTYGSSQQADISGQISQSVPFLEIRMGKRQLKTHLYGDYNFENVMAALCIGKYFNVEDQAMAEAVSSYIPANNRSQVVISKTNTIFLDAYNANPSSMIAAIRQFQKQEGEKKVVILGDMLELGIQSQEEHRKIIDEIAHKFSVVILVGPEFLAASGESLKNVFKNTGEAALWIKENPLTDAHILIKGSRGIALEKLLNLL